MLALGIVAAVYAGTFVGCNERLDGNAKSGFFVAAGIVFAAVLLLGWLFS